MTEAKEMHLFKILQTHVYRMSDSFSSSLQVYPQVSNCTKPRITFWRKDLAIVLKKPHMFETIFTCIKQLFLEARRYVIITQLLYWVWHYGIMNSWRPSYLYCFISGRWLFGRGWFVTEYVNVGISIFIAMLWEKRNIYGSKLLITF